ncbi:DNA-directed RNA beta subunit family protein [Cryptosporidium andersoni]|uniref:DNA-directed RNA polymerase subunit beta n=1 Tax=Cryptosporidium andersoni TaxID=117008 RepID=A0A1J4MDU1_9CRYT|nr:DNA-directed RNA beta subunit family protein [Cryptosporidium andersoni]
MDFEYRERLLEAVWPHIESFNCFLLTGLNNIVINLPSIYIDSDYVIDDCELNVGYIPREYLRIKVTCIKVGKPIFGSTESSNTKMYPCSARNGHLSYSAPLWIEFECYNSSSKDLIRHNLFAGSIPIMVRSLACHLYSLSPNELVANGEDPNEVGGYFIINGNERVIRYVIQQRCNYPVGLKRLRFTSRDIFGTEYAILLRSLRNDGTSTANYLYGTTDNQCVYRILLNRQEWLLPFWNVLLAVGSIYDAKTLRNKILQYCCNTRDEYDPLYSVINMLTIEWGLDNSSGVENCVIPPSYDGAFGDIEIIENRHLHNLGKLVWEGVVFYLPPGSLYQDAGRFIIDNHILVHLPEWNAKLECLILMFIKLLKLQYGQIREESIDSFAYQEILSSGNLYASVLKDAIFSFLQKIRMIYITEIRNRNSSKSEKEASDELPLPYSSAALDLLRDDGFFKTSLTRNISMIPKRIQYFMATGNIKTTQLDLQQLSGWTVVADRLNFNRFLSHFRAVHRGQFFTTMKTTDVRKLMGETWGFLCPVHTPDGEPCGLLLHLSQDTIPVTQFEIQSTLKSLRDYLVGQNIPCDDGLGTLSIQWGSLNLDDVYVPDLSKSVPVMLDGRVMFHIPKSKFTFWQEKLRNLKWSKTPSILPVHTEIACIPPDCGVFSGIFMFTAPGRLVRPVLHLKSNKIDWIGPLAQPWMDIGVTEEETQKSIKLYNLQMKLFGLYKNDNITSDIETTDNIDKNQIEEIIKKDYTLGCNPVMYTHQELHPSTILSITASLIPYAHHNQSPRNMYQCQMLKQTMGTPCYSYPYRTDNRMYRIITPQNPLVITKGYASYGFSEYPTGTNAIVAVISHSGYDMEDAMVLNKASYERGIFHACVYKTKILFAAPNSVIKKSDAESYRFHNIGPDGKLVIKELGADGLPMIGQKLVKGSPMCRVEKLGSGGVISNAIVQTYHDDEEAYVEKINRIGSGLSTESHSDSTLGGSEGSEYSSRYGEKISLKLRIVRNPMVGDKFASRHGQKGILSMLWPHENMPFGESGIVPDILFNPHGFPSRMTVGMLIECMAGKAACLHGASALDATPFHRNITDKQTILEDKEMGIDSSKQSTVDYFGKALLKTGFQYFGCEPLFNGMTGTEMPCHIFMGVIYYQRLRHMVADKAQVRSTGPIDALTRQPVKGRKRHGGIRFGEMERDSLISYGVSSIISDRLLRCSDEHKAYVCPHCGLIFSAILPRKTTNFQNRLATTLPRVAICKVCKISCRLITLPYVFRYLCNELATMNIVIRLELEQEDIPISIKRNARDKSS